ncbi:AAC(3) family N-acetyltransferase [bacterium]|nr:AAC(3) family N-acetyltransferase [bacterium]
MANRGLKHKIMAISPHIEMVIRRVYWNNVGWLGHFGDNKPAQVQSSALDYSKIKSFLESEGVLPGALLLVHSAYGALKGRGKGANEVIEFLLDLTGKNGTLAMPAFPKFDNKIDRVNYLRNLGSNDTVYEYDVKKSRITTGVLPLKLSKKPGAVRSRFPINTMVAFGPLARELFCDEFKSETALACGPGSSWEKCVEHDAFIIGLGTDLTHSLTAIHVAEDSFEADWPIENWYIEKKFKITDGDFVHSRTLRERAPQWGALCFAERTLCKDLMKDGILRSIDINGVVVEVLQAKKLIEFLRVKQNQKPGYPYYWC